MDVVSCGRSPFLGDRAIVVYQRLLESFSVEGDVAECGVFRGDTSVELARIVHQSNADKKLHLFDTFSGLPDIATAEEQKLSGALEIQSGFFSASRETVLDRLGSIERVAIHEGRFAETFPGFSTPLCFVHADADLYASTCDIIDLLDRCLSPGGWVVFDDYGDPKFPGVQLAVDRHLDRRQYAIQRTGPTQHAARRR